MKEFCESGGQPLGLQSFPEQFVVQQPVAEVVQGHSHHSSSVLLVKPFVHLHDEPLGVQGQGTIGPGAHPEGGVGQHVLVGTFHLQGLVGVEARLAQVPGLPDQILGVHVVGEGQLAQQVGPGRALSPFDLGKIGTGHPGKPVDVPQAQAAPETPQQRPQFLAPFLLFVKLFHDSPPSPRESPRQPRPLPVTFLLHYSFFVATLWLQNSKYFGYFLLFGRLFH